MPLRCVYFGHRPSQSLTQRDPMSFELHSACRRCATPLAMVNGKWRVARDNGREDEEREQLRRPAA